MDLRSTEFHQALETWLSQVEDRIAEVEVDPFLEESFDQVLLAQEQLVGLARSSCKDDILQACYEELQESAQILSQEIWTRMGPTCLPWLNQALVDLENFRQGGAHPGYLAALLRGEAEWIARRQLSVQFSTELERVAQILEQGAEASGVVLRDSIEALTTLGLEFGEAVAEGYESNLHVALREASLASTPEERADIMLPVHEQLSRLSAEFENLRSPEMSEASEQSLNRLLDQIVDLDDTLAALTEGETTPDLSEILMELEEDLEHLTQAILKEQQTPCSVCGQNLPDGMSRCQFCGTQAPQKAKVESKVALVASLEREVQKFESGYGELAELIRFVHQEFRRVVMLESQNTEASKQLSQGVAQIKEGFTLLLEVESPGDTRLYRGLEFVELGAKTLETLT